MFNKGYTTKLLKLQEVIAKKWRIAKKMWEFMFNLKPYHHHQI